MVMVMPVIDDDDYKRGYEWNATDEWVRRFNNNALVDTDVFNMFPSDEEIREEEEYKGLDEDAVSWIRVAKLEKFDMAIKTLTAIHIHLAPDAVIDKDEVWKWVWDERTYGEPSKFFYVSPITEHMKE